MKVLSVLTPRQKLADANIICGYGKFCSKGRDFHYRAPGSD